MFFIIIYFHVGSSSDVFSFIRARGGADNLFTGPGADWGGKVARELLSDRPTQNTASCPLNASHVSTSRSPILKITHTLNIILDNYKEITSYMFCLITFGSTNLTGWTLAIVLAIVTLQGRYSFLDEYA